MFFPQHKVVGLLNSARDRLRPSLLNILFSDPLVLAAFIIEEGGHGPKHVGYGRYRQGAAYDAGASSGFNFLIVATWQAALKTTNTCNIQLIN